MRSFARRLDVTTYLTILSTCRVIYFSHKRAFVQHVERVLAWRVYDANAKQLAGQRVPPVRVWYVLEYLFVSSVLWPSVCGHLTAHTVYFTRRSIFHDVQRGGMRRLENLRTRILHQARGHGNDRPRL